MTSQTTQVTFRTEESLKKDAEILFSRIGLNMTTALNVFLRQAVTDQAIPFRLKASPLLDFSQMSETEKNAEIQKGFDSMRAGRVLSSEQIKQNIKRKYGHDMEN
ncbi:MAG: type II toxin-antitoxin system RelB/DinJ family antitoxin [Oscillospiraceae bacterium]|nr:type II toxin-antitoxin system RelB/DinJ family antitoxin [Oscillospiraceae bacterium]